jgi:hypothetical protein
VASLDQGCKVGVKMMGALMFLLMIMMSHSWLYLLLFFFLCETLLVGMAVGWSTELIEAHVPKRLRRKLADQMLPGPPSLVHLDGERTLRFRDFGHSC